MHTSDLKYVINGKEHIGFLAYEGNSDAPRPGVMIMPAFEGPTLLYKEMAKDYAKLGYAAFVVDLYGDGVVYDKFEDCVSSMTEHFENRDMLKGKLLGALDALKSHEVVNSSKIAIMGFCFGGLCALDLARSGADILGAVSIHGALAAPDLPKNKIKSKVLVLHGYEDPQIPPDQLPVFADEMNSAEVDWQFHFFSHTKHAFTDPDAALIGPEDWGRVYNKLSSDRSHQAAKAFFAEIFSD